MDKDQDKEKPFHRLMPKIVTRTLLKYLLARQGQRKLECTCSGLALHKNNDYLIHEQLINAIIDEVNDG
jgi:hypothetical protein